MESDLVYRTEGVYSTVLPNSWRHFIFFIEIVSNTSPVNGANIVAFFILVATCYLVCCHVYDAS